MRLDRAVVERGLARSRSHAQELIAASAVSVDGLIVTKSGAPVTESQTVDLVVDVDHYVSRGAHKLRGALDEFEAHGLKVEGVEALDIGASTGGFTQVLLERGVSGVTAIDVGHGQLATIIAADPRVRSIEGLNVRDMDARSPGAGATLVVGDLSFISLTLALGPLVAVAPNADFVLLIKPQFELERGALDKHGAVTTAADRARAIRRVTSAAHEAGMCIVALTTSILPGPSGNVEYVMWARAAWQASPMAAHTTLDGPELEMRIDALAGGRL